MRWMIFVSTESSSAREPRVQYTLLALYKFSAYMNASLKIMETVLPGSDMSRRPGGVSPWLVVDYIQIHRGDRSAPGCKPHLSGRVVSCDLSQCKPGVMSASWMWIVQCDVYSTVLSCTVFLYSTALKGWCGHATVPATRHLTGWTLYSTVLSLCSCVKCFVADAIAIATSTV